MLHVGIFYRDEKSSCATKPKNTLFRAAKLGHLSCLWGWGSGTSLLLPGSRLSGLLHSLSFTVCVCLEMPVGAWVRAGSPGAQGGAEMLPWGSHIPEDMEGTFSSQAVT